jgi:lysophospholipase L1-like esterase
MVATIPPTLHMQSLAHSGAASSSATATRLLVSLRAAALTLGLACLVSCGAGAPTSGRYSAPTVEQPNPAAVANAGNFSTLVFLGDSLTAGMQNGSLLDSQQVNSYPALLAAQINTPITLPLLAAPGLPAPLQLSFDPVELKQGSGKSAGRDDPTVQATDLAIPGATIGDIYSITPTNTDDPATQYILGEPGLSEGLSLSQAQWAKRLQPTTIVLWAGNVEAIGAAQDGSTANLPSPAKFAAQYTDLIAWLTQNTNAHLVLLNVPDVTTVPYLISAQQVATIAGGSLGVDPNYFYALWGVTPDDYLNGIGLQDAIKMVEDPARAPLKSGTYLTPSDLSLLQSTVIAYNQAIAQQAAQVNATLVDVHAALLDLAQNGTTINGTTVTFQYLGGIFSLDGVHPSNTGYALVANAILESLNGSLKTKFPLVNLGPIAAADPLFPANMPEVPYIPFLLPSQAGHSLRNSAPNPQSAQRNAKGGYVLSPELRQWRDQAEYMEAPVRRAFGHHATPALP